MDEHDNNKLNLLKYLQLNKNKNSNKFTPWTRLNPITKSGSQFINLQSKELLHISNIRIILKSNDLSSFLEKTLVIRSYTFCADLVIKFVAFMEQHLFDGSKITFDNKWIIPINLSLLLERTNGNLILGQYKDIDQLFIKDVDVDYYFEIQTCNYNETVCKNIIFFIIHYLLFIIYY